MFSYVSPEQRVPKDHPLRPIRRMVDEALRELSPRFGGVYAKMGRPSIPPERLLRALLLQVLYTIRSERMLMEQLDYNLLFRWFVGLEMDDRVWDTTVFTKNRERLLRGEIAREFFEAVLRQAEGQRLLSSEHFTVDGTLIEAWASQKSFVRKDQEGPLGSGGDPGNPTVDFKGERRSNDTHVSKTDPEARLTRKRGEASKLAYQGHVLMENRNGLVVQAKLTKVTGRSEREAALEMVEGITRHKRVTLGGDRGYDVRSFVEAVRRLGITPHVTQSLLGRSSAIDGRTVRHEGYRISQKRRKRVEEVFGWMKTIGLLRKTRYRGVERVGWMFVFTAAAYNLVRMRNIVEAIGAPG